MFDQGARGDPFRSLIYTCRGKNRRQVVRLVGRRKWRRSESFTCTGYTAVVSCPFETGSDEQANLRLVVEESGGSGEASAVFVRF